MLPLDKAVGRDAFGRIRAFQGNPYGIEGKSIGKKVEEISTNKFIRLGDLCDQLR